MGWTWLAEDEPIPDRLYYLSLYNYSNVGHRRLASRCTLPNGELQALQTSDRWPRRTPVAVPDKTCWTGPERLWQRRQGFGVPYW
jgi:hypothetical protein